MSGRHYPFGDEGEGGEGPQWPDARQSRPRGDGAGATGGEGRGGYGQSGPTSRRRSPEEGAYGEGAGGARHSGGPTRGGYGPSSAGGKPGPSWGGGDAPTRPSGDGWGNYAGGSGGGYGPSGGYGPPGSYGAPGSFSQPRPPGGSGGYGQAGPPRYGPYGGDPYAGAPPDDYGSPYGQSAPTSRGWNIVPDQRGYGGYDQPSQSTWGAQQEDWNAPAVPERRSRKKLWVTLGVVAALLLCSCGGLGVLAIQFFAPAATAGALVGGVPATACTRAGRLLSKQGETRVSGARGAAEVGGALRGGGGQRGGQDEGRRLYPTGQGARRAGRQRKHLRRHRLWLSQQRDCGEHDAQRRPWHACAEERAAGARLREQRVEDQHGWPRAARQRPRRAADGGSLLRGPGARQLRRW